MRDEEAGRRELLGSTVTGRHAALAAALTPSALLLDSDWLLVLLGALAAGVARDPRLPRLEHYAKCIGLAFQVQDDILDIESDTNLKTYPIKLESITPTLSESNLRDSHARLLILRIIRETNGQNRLNHKPIRNSQGF